MAPSDQQGDLYAAWAAAADVALIVAHPNGTIDYATELGHSITGAEPGDQFEDLLAAAEVEQIRPLIERLHSHGEKVDVTAQLASGETIVRFVITRTVDEAGATRSMIFGFRDVTPQGLRERRLEYEVAHDDLTNVLTRAAIIRGLTSRYSEPTTKTPEPVAALFVDLDEFKGVNDGYGHLTGDEVLKVVANRLQNVSAGSHQVARIGGDEFLLVLGDCRSTEAAVEVAHVVADALAAPIVVGDASIIQRFSIGVAVDMHSATIESPAPSPVVRVERLLAEADMAMYVAKQHGVSVAVANESTRTWSARRLTIERDIRDAMRNGEIEFYYQPIVDLEHGKWMAAEALLRWRHPELGMLPPELVIERAETIGCIDELTTYTIDRVTRDWAELIRRAPVMFHHQVAVNASARQLSWDGFVDTHLRAIELAGLTPGHVLIEVTESSQIELHNSASATLNELAARGIRISLDDFGVGYTTLAYFTQFTVHAVKVDRSLISELRGEGTVADKLLRGVVRIANDLGARVVGEGIETEASAQYCRSLGMAVGQGWYFDRPMPFEDFCRLAPEQGLPRTGDAVVLSTNPQIVGDDQPSRWFGAAGSQDTASGGGS